MFACAYLRGKEKYKKEKIRAYNVEGENMYGVFRMMNGRRRFILFV